MTHEELTDRIIDLDQEGYEGWQIADGLGVTESEVSSAVNRGSRRRSGTGDNEPPRRERCGGCGGMVLTPCLLCRDRRIGGVETIAIGGGPLPGDPTPEEILAEAKKIRKANRGCKPGNKQPNIREYWTRDLGLE